MLCLRRLPGTLAPALSAPCACLLVPPPHHYHQPQPPLQPPRRAMHSSQSCDQVAAVCHLAQGLEWLQESTGLPWWATILTTTIVLRSTITLPLAVYQRKVLAKAELLQPTILEWRKALQYKLAVLGRRENKSAEQVTEELNKELRKVVKQEYQNNGCQPWKFYVPIFAQIPLWITLTLGLRHMMSTEMAGICPTLFLSLRDSSVLWVHDLTLPDASLGLPLWIAACTLLNVEMNALSSSRKGAPSLREFVLRTFFRGLAVVIFMVSANMPAGVCFYWSVSASFGLLQNYAFLYKGVLNAAGVPATPSQTHQPLTDMVASARARTRGFWAEVMEKNFGPRGK
eukprot:m.37512 g.37512  ORF g.37512 m.37512 type:complete len:342 (-) comp13618_c0_seq2:104-1129(-)